LPYEYVIDAYQNGARQRQSYLHQLEAPVSLLSALFANSNRDAKKQKVPHKMEDFFLYQPVDDRNTPTGVYGAAAMELIEQQLFPRWAYCFYKDLKNSSTGNPPNLLGLINEKAIILAPEITQNSVKGMLIMEDVVSEQTIEMESTLGGIVRVTMPKATIRYSAKEGVEVPIAA
jgi:hypothetical protein